MMKERTLQILNALITDFIETANPVASKQLLASHDFKISSATVRNEFAVLEEVGLIHAPHVSAGKVPTEKGYRFFVDELLEFEKAEKQFQSLFEKHISEYKIVKFKEGLFDALRLISSLSGNVAFTVLENDQTLYLGLSNVLRSPEFMHSPEKAAQIVEILEGKDKLQKFLYSIDIPKDEVRIFIGKENILDEISSCAMLVTNFESKGFKGKLGILGPMRMKYGFNTALLKQLKQMIV